MNNRERLDDLQIGGYRIWQDPALFCFGIDAVLLSEFVRVPDGAEVLDLGTGNGVLLFLLAAKSRASRLTGLEIQERAVELARRSIRENALEGRAEAVAGDLCEASGIFAGRKFDRIVCNPPYYRAGEGKISPVREKAIARHEVLCTLDDVLRESAALLAEDGCLDIVCPASRRDELAAGAAAHGLTVRRERAVRSFADRPPHLILWEAGLSEAFPGGYRREEDLVIYREPGVYSPEVLAVYERKEEERP